LVNFLQFVLQDKKLFSLKSILGKKKISFFLKKKGNTQTLSIILI
jgi:hypothetical protein